MAAANNSRRRGRGRFGVLYKLLSFVLILGALVGGCIVFFRVEEITVEGSSVYTPQEVIEAAGVEPGDNIFLIHPVRTGRKVIDALPYVKRVSLTRDLPDALVITVVESVPAAVISGERGEWWLIDSSGKLLEKAGDRQVESYPHVSGMTMLMPSEGNSIAVSVEEGGKLSAMKQVLAAMEEQRMLGQLQSMDLTAPLEMELHYENRFTVRMPMYCDDFHQMVRNLKGMAAYLDSGQTGTIDLTGSLDRFIPD